MAGPEGDTDFATEYVVPPGLAVGNVVARLVERLAGGGDADEVSQTVERRTVLDTFDWRLHKAGLAAEVVGDRLVVRRWNEAAPMVAIPFEGDHPVAVTDLPNGVGRETIGDAVGVRALLGLATVEVTSIPLTVRNRDGKAVVRVAVEQLDVENAPGTKLPARVRLAPVRGYERQAREVADVLTELELTVAADDVVADIAAAVGRQPGDITSKIVVQVDPDEPAAAAYVRGLANFAEAIARNRAGAIAGTDTEFLHDLRVAVRRSRSLLRHAGKVLPEELRDCFAPELAWLQRATSEARDFDVWALELGAGDPLVPFVETQRRRAHDELVAALASARFAALVDDWTATLITLADEIDDDDAGEWGPWPEDAHRSARDVAADRILGQHKRLLKVGERVARERVIADAPAENIHRMRKRAKELRYLFELFAPVFADERLRDAVKDLRALQDTLGAFQDAEVQRHWLDQSQPAGAELALARCDRVQRRCRADLVDRFDRFAEATSRKRLKRILEAGA